MYFPKYDARVYTKLQFEYRIDRYLVVNPMWSAGGNVISPGYSPYT